ncbi:hypothetical protein BLM14_05950 [Phyllobacterium zundukense]|nr:hypothetical protein BLM14_05950 [Phyllobacterium zundukense]
MRERSVGIAGIAAMIDTRTVVIVGNIATRAVVIGADTGMATVVIANNAAAIVATMTGIGTHWQSSASKQVSCSEVGEGGS